MDKKKAESPLLQKMEADIARQTADMEAVKEIYALVPGDAIKDIAVFDEDIATNEAMIRTQKEATKKLVDATNIIKETRNETVEGIKEVLISKGIDDTKIALAYPDVEIVKATKARTKGGPTKEDRVLDAIKGGNNTKKALEAPEAGFDGDVHGQTFTLTKKGLIKATSPGVYSVV